MPKIDEAAKAWQKDMAERVGRAVQTRRRELNISAATLAKRCAELGYPISRVAIGKIETNHREGKFDLAELAALAAALDIAPISLIYPTAPDAPVDMTPGQQVPTFHAIAWFSGDRDLAWPGPDIGPDEAGGWAGRAVADPDSKAATVLRLMRERAELHRDLVHSRFASKREIKLGRFDDKAFDDAATYDGRLIGKIEEKTDQIRKVLEKGDAE